MDFDKFLAAFILIVSLISENVSHQKITVCLVLTKKVIDTLKIDFKMNVVEWANFCTHVVVVDDQFLEIEDMADEQGQYDYKELMNLRKNHPNLKISLIVSAKSYFGDYFKSVERSEKRGRIIKKLTDYLNNIGFNGLDLNLKGLKDYYRPEDVQSLLKDLKKHFVKSKLLLTSTISAMADIEFGDLKPANQSDYFDFVHFLPFEFDQIFGVNFTIRNAFTKMDISQIQGQIEKLIQSGMPAAKIVIGIQFGGPLFETKLNGLESDAILKAFPGYDTICKSLRETLWHRTYDEETKLTILRGRDRAKNVQQIVVFADSRFIANQMHFLVNHELAGGMACLVHLDDFEGYCDIGSHTYDDFNLTKRVPKRNDSTFHLLKTMNEAIRISIEAIEMSTATAPHFSNDFMYISIGLFVVLCVYYLVLPN